MSCKRATHVIYQVIVPSRETTTIDKRYRVFIGNAAKATADINGT